MWASNFPLVVRVLSVSLSWDEWRVLLAAVVNAKGRPGLGFLRVVVERMIGDRRKVPSLVEDDAYVFEVVPRTPERQAFFDALLEVCK